MENGEQHSGRFAIIPSVALDDPRITPALLKVLCVLGTYGDRTGYCWLKLRTLAERLKISPQAVSKSLQHLRDLGYIEIKPKYGDDGRRIRNDYRILFDVTDASPMHENAPQVEGPQLPEVEGSQLPEVEGSQLPEVEALNVPSERPILTLSAAAAISYPMSCEVDVAMPAAAAAWNDNVLTQTAEGVRQRLGMPQRNLAGIADILRQYPEAPQYFIAQAAACAEKLRVRPLKLAHFDSYLKRSEIARVRAEQQGDQGHENHNEHRTSDEDRRRAAQADAERRQRRASGIQAILEKYSREYAG